MKFMCCKMFYMAEELWFKLQKVDEVLFSYYECS